MQFVFVYLFAFCSLVYLFAGYTKQEEIEKLTFPMLSPLILISYLMQNSAPEMMMILFFTFFFLGDITTLYREKKGFFSLGIVSYMVAYLLFASYLISTIARPIPASGFIFSGICLLVFLLFFIHIKKKSRSHSVLISLSFVILCTVCVSATLNLCAAFSLHALFLLIGAVLLSLHSYSLLYDRFAKPYTHPVFSITPFHISALLFILFGLSA